MIHIPQNDYEWWSFFTAYCRDKFLKYSRKGKPIWKAMYLAYEQTIELRTIPGLETRFNSVNFEVKDKWAEKYDKVVTTLYFNTDPDKVRFCEQCGFPMVEGYYLAGEFACCDECCLKAYGGDKEQMEEDLSHADEPDGECYWTEWDKVEFN